MNYFIANFKQNFTLQESKDWLTKFTGKSDENKTIIVAPTSPHLSIFAGNKNFSLAIQNVSHLQDGPHTGRVGVNQIKDIVKYCIIGHSETRKGQGDTDEQIAQKTNLLLKVSITPIICIDTPYLESQITALKHELLEIKDIIIAFEPQSAIGSGHPITPQKANETAFKIKTLINNKDIPILYGGSIDSVNAPTFLEQDFINGFIVGGASLKPDEFAKISNSVSQK